MVAEIKAQNLQGEALASIADMQFSEPVPAGDDGENVDFESVSDVIDELPDEKRRGKDRRKTNRKKRPVKPQGNNAEILTQPDQKKPKVEDGNEKKTQDRPLRNDSRRKPRNKGRNRNRNQQNNGPEKNTDKRT